MNASEQSSDSTNTAEADGQEQAGLASLSDLERLGQALADDDTEQPGGDKGKPSGSDEKAKPTKFNDLAGATDMDLDALYALEATLDDGGEPVTIEQLKDHYKQRADFDVTKLEFEEQRTQQMNDLVRERAELKELLQALPANAVKPEVLQRMRTKMEQTASEERQRTLEAIPEWKNAEARTQDITAMAEHLQGYGFPANQLEQLVDHRWQRYIRDNMLREQRIRSALEKVRKGAPPKASTSKPQAKPPKRGTSLDNIKPQRGQSKLEALLTNID